MPSPATLPVSSTPPLQAPNSPLPDPPPSPPPPNLDPPDQIVDVFTSQPRTPTPPPPSLDDLSLRPPRPNVVDTGSAARIAVAASNTTATTTVPSLPTTYPFVGVNGGVVSGVVGGSVVLGVPPQTMRRAVRIAPMGVLPLPRGGETGVEVVVGGEITKGKRRGERGVSADERTKQKRMLRNRESAARSRDKRRIKNKELERRIGELGKKRKKLEEVIGEMEGICEEVQSVLSKHNIQVH